MGSLNKVQIIGFLGKDVDLRYTPSGTAVANISVATTDTWKDKATGDKREATEWHRVVFFDKLAEIAGEYLKKGSQVYIEGKLKTRKWKDKDGQDRYTTEINGEAMQMLGRKEAGGEGDENPHQSRTTTRNNHGAQDYQNAKDGGSGGMNDFMEDIPF